MIVFVICLYLIIINIIDKSIISAGTGDSHKFLFRMMMFLIAYYEFFIQKVLHEN